MKHSSLFISNKPLKSNLAKKANEAIKDTIKAIKPGQASIRIGVEMTSESNRGKQGITGRDDDDDGCCCCPEEAAEPDAGADDDPEAPAAAAARCGGKLAAGMENFEASLSGSKIACILEYLS